MSQRLVHHALRSCTSGGEASRGKADVRMPNLLGGDIKSSTTQAGGKSAWETDAAAEMGGWGASAH